MRIGRLAWWRRLRKPMAMLAGVPLLSLGLGASAASAAAGAGRVTMYPGLLNPISITAGPHGTGLWFTDSNNSIGRITTTGAVRMFSGGGIDISTLANSEGITAGPDGALWFTNPGNNSIGRITTSGKVTNYTGTGIDFPDGITTGPDGALWFTNPLSDSIGRITTSGSVTSYAGTGIHGPVGITAGPDGALWFTNSFSDSIGRITTTGTVTDYTNTSIIGPDFITAGPDGAMWFTDSSGNMGNAIGRITTALTPAISGFTPCSGAAGTTVTITGQNLSGATAVAFDGTPATIVSHTATQIVTMPAGAATGPITVTTAAGTATSHGSFTVP